MQRKKNIRELSEDELIQAILDLGEKKFRASQIIDWLWNKQVASFDEMQNVPKGLRSQLEEHFFIDKIVLSDQQISKDKTIKCAYETFDKRVVEGVLIPTSSRTTACISSQVGCSLSCKFCATGKLKLLRNLSPGEIVDQVSSLRDMALEKYNTPLTNIVYMGMGEPLLNYRNMMSSIHWITSDKGLGMSPKRITVSTAGIAKMIKKMGDDDVKVNLALSLHAANDRKRSEIMEINDTNNLSVLTEALQYFHEKTGTRVTFEYIIFDKFNDSLEDAAELAAFARCVPCKINIIEYNPIDDGEFQRASSQKTDAFAKFLESKNLVVNVRRSRGKDIDAACGQLANKNKALKEDERVLKVK
ncbi:MAG: 23S rRNA (adenine(2503)-C(2))-methyltransferase RlmN [Bacteroidetes bacterium]|nr:MAG: 23S rRNA (adenine(2503)-C(2))-methyltransferase RlmN [Bacteroidota bacterium]TNF28245.1 MAG: 23S rRNA (adenine(2503)-C(2))-methyltransferase RlmN [Deltaproteobacteria bacterium]